MQAYIVGRGKSEATIVVDREFTTVSRKHVELSVLANGTCRVKDLDSTNGTEVLHKGKWQSVKNAVVSLDHRLRLGGRYEATIRELLKRAAATLKAAKPKFKDKSSAGATPPSRRRRSS